jgi:hypothetical protein
MAVRRSPIWVMLLVAVLGAGGCAFGDRTVVLGYPPKPEGGVVSAALAAETPSPAGAQVTLVPFEDGRARTDIIGDVRNAYGMHTADVVAQNDVAEWVTGAIRTELKEAGFGVVDASSLAASGSAAVVSGEVVNVYSTAYWTYEADVSFYGRVQKGQEILLDKLYSGKESAGTNWAATAESYGQSLGLSLQQAAHRFIADLKTLKF